MISECRCLLAIPTKVVSNDLINLLHSVHILVIHEPHRAGSFAAVRFFFVYNHTQPTKPFS